MTRLTASLAALICCAGAAVAQVDAQAKKSCCPEKAEAVVQTVAVEAVDCSAQKQCSTEQTAQTVATQASQKEGKGSCCPSKGQAEGAAQQVALTEGKNCKTECSDAQQVAASCSTGGKLAALAADMPAIKRKVGKDITNCPVKAGEMSQASGQPVLYLVGQQSFEDQASATQAYAAELTSYLDKATRVTFAVDGECVPCPDAASKACGEGKAMKYRVAGRDFDSAEAAVRAAALAYAASRQVNLNYAVNGECAGSCDKSAKEKSMATAQPVVYRVGDKETQCNVQASVMLAVARIEAAVTAVQAVPQS